MNEKSDILSQIDRRTGMTVPDGYFADFATRMAASLPDRPAASAEAVRRTFWQKSRPYVYMAAMFAGIWCMLKMFQLMGGGSTDLSIDNYPGVITALSNDNFVKEYVYPTIDQYDMLEDIYLDGTSADDLFGDEADFDMTPVEDEQESTYTDDGDTQQ